MFRCGFCGESMNKPDFYRHKREFHTRCPKRVEIESKNRGQVMCRVVCPHCGNSFQNQHCLNVHVKQVHEIALVQCDKCDVVCSNPPKLYRHQRNFHKPMTCEKCGENFLGEKSYNIHVRYKHAERQFKCEICSKEFVARQNLEDHMNIHTGEKPHECDVCQQRFSDRNNMRAHKKSIHMGIKRGNK